MRRYLIKLLYWLLDKEYAIESRHFDKTAIKNFLFRCYGDRGATDYFSLEELKVLKNMARGLEHEQYWIEVGKRQQLSMIVQDFEKEYNLRAADAAKRKVVEKNEQASNGDG
jgi:hypothetical protein